MLWMSDMLYRSRPFAFSVVPFNGIHIANKELTLTQQVRRTSVLY